MNVLPIAIIGFVAALLAFDKRYKDGVIRHTALGGIVTSSIIIVLYQNVTAEYDFPLELVLFLWSCAIFISCHGYSFVRWKFLDGRRTWSKAVDEE